MSLGGLHELHRHEQNWMRRAHSTKVGARSPNTRTRYVRAGRQICERRAWQMTPYNVRSVPRPAASGSIFFPPTDSPHSVTRERVARSPLSHTRRGVPTFQSRIRLATPFSLNPRRKRALPAQRQFCDFSPLCVPRLFLRLTPNARPKRPHATAQATTGMRSQLHTE